MTLSPDTDPGVAVLTDGLSTHGGRLLQVRLGARYRNRGSRLKRNKAMADGQG